MAGLAAPVLIGLLLFASGATAAGDDGAMELPHLQLPGTADSGLGHGRRDAERQQRLPAAPRSGRRRRRRAHGVLPDDKAVVAFEPTFGALAEGDRLDVLLHHATAGRYVRAQLAAFDWVAVRTLAANRSQIITVRDDGDTMWLWTSWQGGAARVIKTVSEEEAPLALAVYLVDAVLLPGHLRQKLDGGYLAWLHSTIPVWVGLGWALAAMVGVLTGSLLILGAMSRRI
ncbi:hypothetical protein ACQ4PT_040831 [Festuca glaucescens]